eukprot:14639951-Alexandrium_andersonii.AAC.1
MAASCPRTASRSSASARPVLHVASSSTRPRTVRAPLRPTRAGDLGRHQGTGPRAYGRSRE